MSEFSRLFLIPDLPPESRDAGRETLNIYVVSFPTPLLLGTCPRGNLPGVSGCGGTPALAWRGVREGPLQGSSTRRVPSPPEALTEDDEEPDDKRHHGEDQPPVADGLIVWGGGGHRGQPREGGEGLQPPAARLALTIAEPVQALLGRLLWKRGESPVGARAWAPGRGGEVGRTGSEEELCDFLQVQPSQPRNPKLLVSPQEDSKLTVCSQDAFAGRTSPKLRVSCAQGPGLAVSGTSPEHRAAPGAATLSGSLPPHQPHPPEGCVSPRRAPYLMAHSARSALAREIPLGSRSCGTPGLRPHISPSFQPEPPQP